MAKKPFFENVLEGGLFASRWLMAPFYVGLVAALGALLVVFFQELITELPALWTLDAEGHFSMNAEDGILLALSLIDLSLAGNLVVIVMFAGYENFVSKIDTGDHEDRPSWMGTVDFSDLKLKLIASIVAISGISLLKNFMEIGNAGAAAPAHDELFWLVVIHLTFVTSGLLMAMMDWLVGQTKAGKKGD